MNALEIDTEILSNHLASDGMVARQRGGEVKRGGRERKYLSLFSMKVDLAIPVPTAD
jgi:hypothetical protein